LVLQEKFDVLVPSRRSQKIVVKQQNLLMCGFPKLADICVVPDRAFQFPDITEFTPSDAAPACISHAVIKAGIKAIVWPQVLYGWGQHFIIHAMSTDFHFAGKHLGDSKCSRLIPSKDAGNINFVGLGADVCLSDLVALILVPGANFHERKVRNFRVNVDE
jgi:hypothetical protein